MIPSRFAQAAGAVVLAVVVALTVPVAVTVVEETQVDVLLDIDLPASLTLKGNGTWVLRPVMRQTISDLSPTPF